MIEFRNVCKRYDTGTEKFLTPYCNKSYLLLLYFVDINKNISN